MKVCLMIEGQEGVSWPDWVRLGRLAEEHGFDGLFRSDHYTTIFGPEAEAHDAWATLAGLATLTERIRLGTLVSPVTFRHPSLLARMVATVDHISGGRVELGMGSGWYEREHEAQGFAFPEGRERFALLAEQVEIVIRSWGGERFDHDGPAYTLRGQLALPQPVQQRHPPLLLGGTVKPRFAALAAGHATEVNTLGAPLEELRERKAALDRACARAGRDPASLAFSVMTSCFVGESREDAHERVGRFLARIGDDTEPEEFVAQRADRWLVGSVEEIAERIDGLASVGVSRVFLQHLNAGDDEMIALVGERLLPHLR
jgi:F420-dependent oxidoreductase-like protein